MEPTQKKLQKLLRFLETGVPNQSNSEKSIRN
jgi:hypothetical protein